MPRSGHLRIAIAAVSTPWNNTAHPLPPTTLDSGHIPIPPCLWWYLEVIDHGLSHLEKRVGLVKHHGTAAPDCVLLEVCAQCVFVCVCVFGEGTCQPRVMEPLKSAAKPQTGSGVQRGPLRTPNSVSHTQVS